MMKKYLVIIDMSSSKLATVHASRDDAANYLNESIEKWGDNVIETTETSSDIYRISFHNGVYLTATIKSFDSAMIKFHLAKYDHEKYIETRRFSLRENVLRYVANEFDRYDYDTDEDENEAGEWQLKDQREDVDLKFVSLVVVEDGKSGSKYHEILGVDKSASKDDVKSAYRSKSKRVHPDMGGDIEAFRQINEAYKRLISDEAEDGTDTFSEAYANANIQDILSRAFKRADESNNTYLREEARRVATRKIAIGLAWVFGGGLLTIVTYSSASGDGGYYFIFWGAIIIGAWDVLRGLYWLANPQSLIAKAVRNMER